jgi:hypothetical protein
LVVAEELAVWLYGDRVAACSPRAMFGERSPRIAEHNA